MAVLEEYAQRRFFEGLVDSIAVHHSQVEDFRGRIEAACERAALYGIVHRNDLLWFIHLDLQRGAAWELEPRMNWALEVLDAAESDVAGRRYRLEKKLRNWDAHEH